MLVFPKNSSHTIIFIVGHLEQESVENGDLFTIEEIAQIWYKGLIISTYYEVKSKQGLPIVSHTFPLVV